MNGLDLDARKKKKNLAHKREYELIHGIISEDGVAAWCPWYQLHCVIASPTLLHFVAVMAVSAPLP